MKELLRSFAGGVITPEMFGRLDMTKFQTGLAEAINFHVLPHGPMQNRAGTEWVMEAKDNANPTCLIPFVYSSTQAYALEFGSSTIRIHALGGTVLENSLAVTNVLPTNPLTVGVAGTPFNVGDTVFLSGLTSPTELNGRFVKVATNPANSITVNDLAGNSLDGTSYAAYGGGGAIARVYEIASPFAAADLFDLHYTQDADVLTLTHPNYPPYELRRLGATNWTLTVAAFVPSLSQPTPVSATASPSSGTVKQRYKVTAVGPATSNFEESTAAQPATSNAGVAITAVTAANPGVFTVNAHGRSAGDNVTVLGVTGLNDPVLGTSNINGLDLRIGTVVGPNQVSLVYQDGTNVDTTLWTAYVAGGTLYLTDVTNDLSVAGNKNTITWTANGAFRYNVFKNRNGIYGYIGQTSGNSFTDQNITQNESVSVPEPDNPFVGAGNYPAAVGYFQQRRWFAGTNNKKQNAWATRSGFDSNLTYHIPSLSDDRIAFKIKARQQNPIRHIVPMNALLFLTSSGEWRIASSNGEVLTPSTIDPIPDMAVGASNMQPIIYNSSCLYAADRGAHIREIQFDWKSTGYVSNDLSIMAPHYADNFTFKQCAFARAPFSMGWFVRSDGVLIGLTYVPEQDIKAWHSHVFGGVVESVCTIPEGNEDVLYLVVRRTLQGRSVRCVERLHSRLFTTLAASYFVDCGFSYSGAPVTNVTNGLWHLEGQTVSILGDGAVFPQQVVTNGRLPQNLDSPCSVIQIGIPYTAKAKTLPVALDIQAFGQGTTKNVDRAYLRLSNTSAVKVGPDYDHVREFKQRTIENMGSPPAVLDNKIINMLISPKWSDDGSVCVVQDQPLPTTVQAMVLEVAKG